jgi:hypothetical protein
MHERHLENFFGYSRKAVNPDGSCNCQLHGYSFSSNTYIQIPLREAPPEVLAIFPCLCNRQENTSASAELFCHSITNPVAIELAPPPHRDQFIGTLLQVTTGH